MTSVPQKITIHQPDFLPWVGFFRRWTNADLLILLDDVQFIRRGWHHRDKIKSRNGAQWLTIPVEKKGNFEQSINEVRICQETDWRHRHLNLIWNNYQNAPQFDRIYPELEQIYAQEHKLLITLNMAFLTYIANKLSISTPVQFSSQYGIKDKRTEKLVNLTRSSGGNAYVTGTGSQKYLDESLFASNGILVIWDRFDFPKYPQLHSDFIPNLSILDAMMMLPPKEIVRLYSGEASHAQVYV